MLFQNTNETNRKCKKCKTEFPKSLPVCPNCGLSIYRQYISFTIIGILTLSIIVSIIIFAVNINKTDDFKIPIQNMEVVKLDELAREPEDSVNNTPTDTAISEAEVTENTQDETIAAVPKTEPSSSRSRVEPTTAPSANNTTPPVNNTSASPIDSTAAPSQEQMQTIPETTPPSAEEAALSKAKSYITNLAFSYNSLLRQLRSEGFTDAQAIYAVNNCNADWNEQAAKKAKSYLNSMAFSYQGLISQLEGGDLFTPEQAAYAVDTCNADWFEQAAKRARSYLINTPSYTRDRLITQLEFEKFTHEQAVYGVEANGL